MVEFKELILIRATILFLLCTFIFRWEFWPVSHYPVFATPIETDKFTSYRFALSYSDGRIIFPLVTDNARRLDIYFEHEFHPAHAATRVGKLNMYAAISFLRLSYVGKLDEFMALLEGVNGAFILVEWHVWQNERFEVVRSERIFQINDDELYDQLL